MARTGLIDIRALPDPLLQYNFDLVIPNIPGGGDTNALKVKCISTSIPGKSLEEGTLDLHGVTVKYAGRQMFSHTLQVTILETRDMSTRNALSAWLNFARDARNNTGSYKTEYVTTASLILYDDTAAIIRTINLDGFFIQSMDDSAVDGNSSAPVNIAATFNYDTWYDA